MCPPPKCGARKWKALRAFPAVALASLIGGCAPSAPALNLGNPLERVASRWHAPLPHDGQVEDLRLWWSQFDDPLLPALIAAAQRASPTLAQARANLAEARSQWISSGAALQPRLDVAADAGRGRVDLQEPAATLSSMGLQARWELDMFGANRAGRDAAQARLLSRQAGWHAARVSVAAEVAGSYIELRACEARLRLLEQDVASRQQTARLTALAANAGLTAPTDGDLASASAAQGESALIQQHARCALWLKALVALSDQDEHALRDMLERDTARLPRPAGIQVAGVPAAVLAQRPDIQAAELDVVAAGADVAQTDAWRMPRITLTGNLGLQHLSTGGVRTDGTVWQIGPVSITMPLFDGGKLDAMVMAARIRHQSTATIYAARLREAIQEVESALVRLHSAADREVASRAAVDGFTRAYFALQAGYRAGTESLL
ncbi:efflux transporter outer membrane subunit, partial [Achromobacter sp.]|uniref:efflux transporter outer membrane subunit n=1 Tax=Achromobacter sp. TaxID=134375 RepID=UPI0028AD6798